MKTTNVSWDDFDKAMVRLVKKIKDKGIKPVGIFGIPRGGLFIAVRLSHLLGGIPITHIPTQPNIIVCDEIVDCGKTMAFFIRNNPDAVTACWHLREGSICMPDLYAEKVKHKKWINYPWERK